MESKEPQVHSDVFLVSGAGNEDVNGIYRNVDGGINEGALIYNMTNSTGETFELCLSACEVQGGQNWIIKEHNKDHLYKAQANGDFPAESDWVPDGVGQEPSPNVKRIPSDLEHELKTRLINLEMLSTLDLCDQYERYCKPSVLKKLYKFLWSELTEEVQEAVKAAKKNKQKPVKKNTIKKKIQIVVQLGVTPLDGSKGQSFNMMLTFNTLVQFLLENIAPKVSKEPGKDMVLMFNGHKILSKMTHINALGIEKGSTIIVLGVKSKLQGKGLQRMVASPSRRPKKSSSMAPLEESESNHIQEEDEKEKSLSDSHQQNGKTCLIF